MKKDKEELKKFKNPRDLSSKEYENLTLELKCCFFLKPWNISADIKTVEDWVNVFHATYLDDDVEWKKVYLKNICRNDVNSLIAFTKRMVYDEFWKKWNERIKDK